MIEPKPIVRFKWEYSNFLEFMQDKKMTRALLYAKSLGIDRRTLINWLAQPEMRVAVTEAIDEVVNGMKEAGKDDWRMYKELYQMLGLDDIKSVDLTSDGEPIQVIIAKEYSGEPKFRTDTISEPNDLAKESS